jgi:hypothetical protein
MFNLVEGHEDGSLRRVTIRVNVSYEFPESYVAEGAFVQVIKPTVSTICFDLYLCR